MKIIYSDKQKPFKPRWEWNFGKKAPYPEKNSRVEIIVRALKKRGYGGDLVQAKSQALKHVLAIHDLDMVRHIQACRDMPEGQAVHAHIFPYRTYEKHPKTDLRRAGYYCFDVGTQIDRTTFDAAKSAVDAALHGAKMLLQEKETCVFALSRPPGHHADTSVYGGYCYFNNAAIAAYYLSRRGRVSIVDLDFHHGNGTQSIFYEVPHISFASLHADPRRAYPYFCGFASERGAGLGKSANLNVPLPAGVDDATYLDHLERVLRRVRRWSPTFLVLSLGFDTFCDDPLGDFELSSDCYGEIGARIRRLQLPTLICLEGGYAIKALGDNAANFCDGLCRQD